MEFLAKEIKQITNCSIKKTIDSYGCYGGIFILSNNTVIKISRNNPNYYSQIKKIFNRSKLNVRVYKHGNVNIFDEDYYFYTMEKLKPVPKNERDFLLYVLRNVDFINLNLLSDKVKTFATTFKRSKKRYLDLHTGNIMMDSKNNYKFIDLEGYFKL